MNELVIDNNIFRQLAITDDGLKADYQRANAQSPQPVLKAVAHVGQFAP